MLRLVVDIKTLYDMCSAFAEHCQAILPRIKHEIKTDYAAVTIDETPWRILSDKTYGQMWVISNRLGSYYQFEPTHSGAIAEETSKATFDDYPAECGQIIELIDQLFAIEREAKSIENIRTLRITKSRPVIDEIRNFIYKTKPRFMPNEGIQKAINYCLNHWKGFTHFLTDSTVIISNNEAERALRHVAVGRLNI